MEARIVQPLEQAQEKLFYKRLTKLSKELKIGEIDCQLWHGLKPPFLIINGETFDKRKNVQALIADVYQNVFSPTTMK